MEGNVTTEYISILKGETTLLMPVADLYTVELSPASYTSMGIYLMILGIFATSGNLIVIVTFLGSTKFRLKAQNFLILNVAIADLGFSASAFPMLTASNFANRWLFGEVGCTFNGFICTLLSLVDINTLLVISIYRYIIICRPEYSHSVKNKRTCYTCIAAIWVYSLFWSLIVFTGWTSYTQEIFGTSCSIDLITQSAGVISYNVLLVIFEYLIHIIIMAICYFKIHKRYREVKQKLKSSSSMMSYEEFGVIKTMFSEHKTTLMMITMVASFLIVWTPYAIICLWTAVDTTSLPLELTVLPTMFAKLGCLLNPIIYFISNKTFRDKALLFLIRCKWDERPSNAIHPEEGCASISRRHKLFLEMAVINCTKDGVYIGNNSVQTATIADDKATVF